MSAYSKDKADYSWVGWAIAALIGLIWIISIVVSHNAITSNESASGSSGWHCVDATSYNHNAYDDNKCANGSEVKYVSDSEAEALEADYSPGKSGASYYNNQ